MEVNLVQKEVLENIGIDWPAIKKILCDVAATLEGVCQSLPPGLIKSIVCGVAAALQLLCQSLPDSAK